MRYINGKEGSQQVSKRKEGGKEKRKGKGKRNVGWDENKMLAKIYIHVFSK